MNKAGWPEPLREDSKLWRLKTLRSKDDDDYAGSYIGRSIDHIDHNLWNLLREASRRLNDGNTLEISIAQEEMTERYRTIFQAEEEKRKQKDDFVSACKAEFEGFIRDHYGMDELRIEFGSENKIRYVEEIFAINDVKDVLVVTLKDQSQLEWLREELKEPDFVGWIDGNSHGDRKAINERYGFA
jgi:hypothetical protein